MLISMRSRKRAIERFESDISQALRKPERLTVPDWADKYRRLAASVGAISGRWRTSNVEVARGPMMAATEKGVRTITCMVATQTLKSELLLNIIGRFAHLDPCPIILTQPKDEAVKKFSKERLSKMTGASPVLRDLLGGDRHRGGGDTLTYREFPGGFLALESAGSPTNMAMRAARITLADEIDKYEVTKEGDPISLLEERSATFKHTRLHVRCCSPTWEETSRIYKSYMEGDQREAFVVCPHCNHEQVLSFFKTARGGAYVDWSKSEDGVHFPMTAALYCEECGAEWSEMQRLRAVTTKHAIRWQQTREFTCCDEVQEPLKNRKWDWDEEQQAGYALCKHCEKRAVSNSHASFRASKLLSPFTTVVELAVKWLEQMDDPETKQTFYNTQLGLPYSAQVLRKVEPHALASRREQYLATVPLGVLMLTAGIDVQAGSEVNTGRIEIEVVGWGIDEESWSIDHMMFHGDPAKPDVWGELDGYLRKGFDYEGGQQMFIRGACIDSGGHNTEEVYKFARARIGRNIWAIKGIADRSGQWAPVWPIPKQEPGRTRVTGYKPVMIGVNSAKEAVRQRLLIEDVGSGFCHFPVDRPENWFEQLTSESLMVEKKGGFNVRRWHLPRGRANEALDCRVYAYAALCGLYATRKLNLVKVARAVEAAPQVTQEPRPLADVVRPAREAPQPRRSAFVG